MHVLSSALSVVAPLALDGEAATETGNSGATIAAVSAVSLVLG
jgi:hypothetical protein